jgi:spore maturation protein CgeB
LRRGAVDRLLGRAPIARIGRAAATADLVLSYNAHELGKDAIESVRRSGKALWVNWFPDSPHRLEVSLRNGAAYDRCFLFDRWMVDRHRALGRRADFLPLGFDPALCRPIAGVRGPTAPLLFVGPPEPFRDAALARVADLGLELWGPKRPRGPLFGEALVRAHARAEIALNIHQFFGEPTLDRYGTGANQRVFELAGMGVTQLCDAKADIPSSFVEDREIVLFRTGDELRAKAQALLADPPRRAAIAAAARSRALADHTWEKRLEELLTAVFR